MRNQDQMVQNLKNGIYYIRIERLKHFIQKYGVAATLALDNNQDGTWALIALEGGDFPDEWYGMPVATI